MERTERLLDLVALLLDATEPITWAEIREAFREDYGSGTNEAAERKFERDKAELVELGIPITYQQGDDERRDGYTVDREGYYLPDVKLTPEEVAVLYAAGSAALASGAFPGAQDLSHALRKVGFLAGNSVTTPRVRMELGHGDGGDDLAGKLETLWAATASRKWVELAYWSPRSGTSRGRRVDPYGLALRRGFWSLVGYCHTRKGIRTFHVHRIQQMDVNSKQPRTADFEVPKDFSLDQYVASHPWQHRFHDPVPVSVELSGELAPLAERLLPGGVVDRTGERTRVTVTASFIDGLCRYVLALAPNAAVVAPQQAVDRFREMSSRVAQLHRGAA